MREIIGDTSQESYKKLWESVKFDGKGSVEMVPVFSHNHGSFSNLGLTSTKEDMFKAVIESLTFETRRIVDQCARYKKGSLNSVRIGGGAANSPEWLQLRADITGKTFERMENIEVSSLGAAVLAAVSVSVYRNITDAVAKMVVVKDAFTPNKEVYDRYDSKYQAYVNKVDTL